MDGIVLQRPEAGSFQGGRSRIESLSTARGGDCHEKNTGRLRFTQTDVRFLRKDVAVVHVSMELHGDARTPDARHTTATFVLTQQDGGWLIAAAQTRKSIAP
jgi:uncharacterized protein (TIGR02246 family)